MTCKLDRAQHWIHPYDFLVGLSGARTTPSKVLRRGVAQKSHLPQQRLLRAHIANGNGRAACAANG
ncbi:uncharacterized protein PgNI_08105 [Pyricularia grisea]|uniref:Uncharacterized protein n=1 Tax=Pyricularia grisea TaxID=148305 RepID=A0A6P8AVS7_PYRGI|nr:uncharacterized protein PgNI_08105 [Pyricularia grisea]TLD06274.1 hypothetical protein PgNI_08105 [Pyricularia grisea]